MPKSSVRNSYTFADAGMEIPYDNENQSTKGNED